MSDRIRLPFGTKAVLFDLDDTLHYRSKAFRGWAEWFTRTHLLINNDEQQKAAVELLVELDEHGYTPRETFVTRLREAYPTTTILNNTVQAFMLSYHTEVRKHLVREAEIYALLQAFKTVQIPFGIVTNGCASQQQKKIELLGYEKLTSCIFISGALGIKKPDPAIFLAATRCLGVPPQEVLFVGDHCRNDIWGAHQVGMRTIWIQHAQRSWPEELPSDIVDKTVSSLAELPSVFGIEDMVQPLA